MDNYDYIEFHCPHCGKYIYLCIHDTDNKEVHEEKYSCSCGKVFKVEYDRILAELNIKTGLYFM
jgi:predicted RNA-binding Zn-ribbon protein involved in translation (DUF1610 family)